MQGRFGLEGEAKELFFVEQHLEIIVCRPGLQEHQKVDEFRSSPAVDESPVFLFYEAVTRWGVPGTKGQDSDILECDVQGLPGLYDRGERGTVGPESAAVSYTHLTLPTNSRV